MVTGGAFVHEALREAGITHVIGIPGRGTLPLDRRVRQDDDMTYVLARHETSIPYIAWGYYLASGRPAATVTIAGPGDTNASNGLRNATIDRVPIVHICSEVPPDQRGTGFIHEIDPDTFNDVVKINRDITDPDGAPSAIRSGIEEALTQPLGPVRLGMPFLGDDLPEESTAITPERRKYDNSDEYERAAEALADAERPVVYVGSDAKRSPGGPRAVQKVVETLDAPVITSYAGKGAYPETDARWAGTTGAQLPAGTERLLEEADVVLALGVVFGGPTTRNGSFAMGETLIHVTSDPKFLGRRYQADIGIVDDIESACARFVDHIDASRSGWSGNTLGPAVREEYQAHIQDQGMFEDRSPAPTPAVVRTLREQLPAETIVVADIAEFRTWAMQLFEAPDPAAFIATGSWTSMGVGLPGAIGAKLGKPDRPVVCMTGDGGLFQCLEELHTAADLGLDLTTVVFNNGHLAMISTTPGLDDRFGWSTPPKYASLADGLGWSYREASSPSEAGTAVNEAQEIDGPVLVDVKVDPDEPSSMDAWTYESSIDFR